jgi:hypothetical protein
MSNTSQEIRDRVASERLLDLERAGRAPHPDSPSGKSLLASYRRWQQGEATKGTTAEAADVVELRQCLEALKEMLAPLAGLVTKTLASSAVSTPEVIEDSAQRRSEEAVKAALLGGAAVGSALNTGFQTYRGAGGKLTLPAWKKRTARR